MDAAIGSAHDSLPLRVFACTCTVDGSTREYVWRDACGTLELGKRDNFTDEVGQLFVLFYHNDYKTGSRNLSAALRALTLPARPRLP